MKRKKEKGFFKVSNKNSMHYYSGDVKSRQLVGSVDHNIRSGKVYITAMGF